MNLRLGYKTQAIPIDGVDTLAVQNRTLSVLRLSSTFSRGAVSASFPVAVLAIEDLLGNEARWAGLSTASSTVGSALAAGLLATFMQRRGRTPGLSLGCLLYTSPSPRDQRGSRMPSSA